MHSTPPEQLYGIVGHPLGHSLSPALHTWNFHRLGLPAVYLRWDIPPQGLEHFVTAVRTLPIAGASVTIPHKEAVIPLLDGLTPAAGRMGAVNTLFWQEGRLLGDNTDARGFMAPLLGRRFQSALVLGAGGAARAVLAGLQDLEVAEIHLANRSQARAALLAADFGCKVLPWEERTKTQCDIVINTTPLGMQGRDLSESPWPDEEFRPGQLAYDLVYNPLRTRFLTAAAAAGCEVVDGLAMFLGQAAEQCRIWTNKELPSLQAREFLAQLLERPQGATA